MKKYIYLLLAGAFTLGTTTSCDDYLEVDQYEILPSDYMFKTEANVITGLNGIYDTFYTDQETGLGDDQVWGFKPHVFAANHPTMDCQASGWDAEWQRHAWKPDKESLESAWRMSYRAIDRANRFLEGLATADPSIFADSKSQAIYEAEARAIRAYNYLYLTKLYGRVPMLVPGETYSSTPSKPRPETLDENYATIEQDFVYARDVLDWEPLNGQYGRVTKGFCKAYLAELYMKKKDYNSAKAELKSIIEEGPYKLEPCYGNLHNEDTHWTKESIFEIMYHKQDYMGWGANSSSDAMIWFGFMCAAPEWGGWGSMCLSWELVKSFEPGDKRRQYSIVAKGDTNPFTGQTVGVTPSFDGLFQGSENMPTVYSLKYWRCKPGDNNQVYNPISLTLKRLAGVMLDYAECCFETGDAATGWEMIRQIRNRAWGNLEPGATVAYFPKDWLNTETVEVPDAQTYYAQYKAKKGYTSDLWKVAVIMERRYELNAEFSLYHDLCRMGMCDEWFKCEYPKTAANSSPDECLKTGDSFRYFEHQAYQELFPIPTNEILSNSAIGPEDQNPGY
ncbi:RagB/SusD family nutrient uptake outer membrane protein [Bacteroides sp.]|uniref:RagB/SusD family nutrient uptake outer membrane protein n=1 Tax=Bacteroides sp. TaxID=29523 RepID=UPI003AB35125